MIVQTHVNTGVSKGIPENAATLLPPRVVATPMPYSWIPTVEFWHLTFDNRSNSLYRCYRIMCASLSQSYGTIFLCGKVCFHVHLSPLKTICLSKLPIPLLPTPIFMPKKLLRLTQVAFILSGGVNLSLNLKRWFLVRLVGLNFSPTIGLLGWEKLTVLIE